MSQIPRNQSQLAPFLEKSIQLCDQVNSLDWNELEEAIEECITNKGDTGLSESYEPASYFPLIAMLQGVA